MSVHPAYVPAVPASLTVEELLYLHTENDSLSGEDVLPGFSHPLRTIL